MKPYAHSLLAGLLSVLTLLSPGSCQQECDTPIELGFLVDQSGSISRANFDKMKKFILTVIAGFDVSKKGTHVGIIKYSSNATTVISFDEFEKPDFDYKNLNKTIDEGLEDPYGAGTRIDLALEKADKELFANRKYRTFVPKILLVLTDGQQSTGEEIPDVNLLEASKKLIRKGVEVFVLGVGTAVNIPELLQIAAHNDKNVFLAKDFDDLKAQVRGLIESFCKVCRRDLDIAFLIPTVNAVGTRGLQDIKTLINALLPTFGVRKYKGVHVGLVTCSEVGQVVMNFNDHFYISEIRNILESVKLDGNRLILQECLNEASDNLFDVRGGIRNTVDKYLVVFGDGISSFSKQDIDKALLPLRNQGVKIVGVSLSSDETSVERLRSISSKPTNMWFKQVRRREIQNAALFARSISEKLCKEKQGKCPYTVKSETCSIDDLHECDTDQDSVSPCPEDKKCCLVGCERRCVSPIPDCFNPVDIALLIDTSRNQGTSDKETTLNKFKAFAKRLLYSFSITENAGRVAVLTYDEETKVHAKLGSEPYFWNVEQKIDTVKQSNRDGRDLEEALRFTKENVFTLEGGVRQGTSLVLVILSTGGPTTRTSLYDASDELKRMGVQIFGVHSGTDSSSYLSKVVSQSSFLSTSLGFDDLDSLQNNLVKTVCSTKYGKCRNPECSRLFEDTCTEDYSCPGQEKCCPGLCNSCVQPKTDCLFPMDLAFIVQDSLATSEFQKVKMFMKGVLNALDAGRTQTWIGIITFDSRATINLEFGANQGNSIEERRRFLYDAIDKLVVSPGSSTDGAEEAFVLAKNRLFTAEAGSHPSELRSVIFISNGKLKEPNRVADASFAVRKDIDNVLVVAATEDPDVAALERIAINQGRHVYLTTSFKALDQYRNIMATETCKEGIKIEETPVTVVRGPTGDNGVPGEKGAVGSVGLPGNEGQQGDTGLGGETGIPGETGKIGIPGRYGIVGAPGAVIIERSGEKGPFTDFSNIQRAQRNLSSSIAVELAKIVPRRGPAGKRGPKGMMGSPGPQGNSGQPGEFGLCGGEGDIGLRGSIGIPGEQGIQGPAGGLGATGVLGKKGLMGEYGRSGLKGFKGSSGNQGFTGQKGEDGEVGVQGERGARGKKGQPGLKGSVGMPGRIGVPGLGGFRGRKGKEGKPGGFGLKGDKGPRGDTGDNGLSGRRGVSGPDGFIGLPGSIGPAGDDAEEGRKGRTGGSGETGKQGPMGSAGKPGDPGEKGVTGPKGLEGAKGFPGVNGENGDNGEEGEHGIPGERGSQGVQGDIGDQGTQGTHAGPGARGAPGEKGNIGIQGGRGIEGTPGPKGEPGEKGGPGPPGSRNDRGVFGMPGRIGEKGQRGGPGKPGRRGAKGVPGYRGDPGLPGTKGSSGNPGFPGSDGLSGFHGPMGDYGSAGRPGPPGPNGLPGRVGQNGESGPPGPQGPNGLTGPPGFPGPPGIAAPPGLIGLPGEVGEKGKMGRKGGPGNPGRIGEDGEIGDKGPRGNPGTPGTPATPGPTGLQGEQGPAGDQGLRGRTGAEGARGKRGLAGSKGKPGTPGIIGRDGLVGPPGATGKTGPPGEKGKKGNVGARGKTGKPGRNGPSGEEGTPWIQRVTGRKGAKGESGEPGDNGRPGLEGRTGTPGVAGSPGPNGATGLQGPPGKPGLPGQDGPLGRKGPEGDPGIPGLRGSKGIWGIPGGPGLTGPRGDQGPKGVAGFGTLPGQRGNRGPKGFPGSIGLPGNPAANGKKGSKGALGLSGDKGTKGPQGVVGPNGTKGEDGDSGAKGLKGEPGVPGVPGGREEGDIGEPGPPGESGVIGETGEAGEPGKKGNEGMQGIKGVVGIPGEPGGTFGPRGIKGEAGPPGEKGDTSPKGAKGAPGDPGEPGKSVFGDPGPLGPPGLPGIKGNGGLQGQKGVKGFSGSKGLPGLRGGNGTVGTTGIVGKAGEKGVKGDTGKPGVNAKQGEKGAKGAIGFPGQGIQGNNGSAGPSGADGARGPPGLAVKGTRGPEGNAGEKGLAGMQGPPGPPGRRGRDVVSFDGTTISIYYNESYNKYFQVDLNSNISKQYFSIQLDMALYKKPNGTKNYPAISCADLIQSYPSLDNGQYWIDPNEGSPEDAEHVFCRFEMNATCLEPWRKKTENKKWFTGPDGYKWFTGELDNMQNADKFNYTFDDAQLQMLQLHSNEAWQEITYHCLNSVAWSNVSALVDHSIKFQGDDDSEFHNQMPQKLRPVVIEDNCQIKTGKWNKTIIEVKSKNPINLPIRDIGVFDVGDAGEEFGLELGRACFAP